MRQFVVNAAFRGVREATPALGVSTVRNVARAAFAAAMLFATGVPDAFAGDRHAAKQTVASSGNVRGAAQSKADSGSMERKCIIMSCGTPWCYSVKR